MKKRGKQIISLALCLALLFVAAACGADKGNTPETGGAAHRPEADAGNRQPEEVKAGAENSEASDNEIILTDQDGNEVKLNAPAERIVSCYYVTTYACIALGLEDRLAGIESKADKRPVYALAAPELLELPDVGTLKEFNVEAAAAVEPDLVIMPKRLSDSAGALKELGIPVLIVYPESQALLEEMLTLIGRACGAEENADRLLKYYEEAESELAGFAGEKTDTKVYMAGVSSYLKTAPKGMYQAEMIRKVGGRNAAGNMEGDAWAEVSYEDILAMNPDMIIVPSSAEYGVEELTNDINLAEVNAVKSGAVYQMPKGLEEWDSPVPSGILGVRWLCSILHEDTYSREEMEKDVREFYQTFYGFAPEDIVW